MSRTKSKFDELLKTYKLQDYNTLEFIDELKSNPLLTEYDINISNCNMFAAYLADCSNCSLCKGLDECKNEIKGYSSKISFDNGYFLKKIPCKYKSPCLRGQPKRL